MSAPTTLQRVEFKRHLLCRFLPPYFGEGVCHYDWPGLAGRGPVAVWGGPITGPVSIPSMRSGRKRRDEEGTLTVFLRVDAKALEEGDIPAEAADEAGLAFALDLKAMSTLDVLESALADDPRVGDFPGLVFATVGQVDGPGTDPTPGGANSMLSVEIDFQIRLS